MRATALVHNNNNNNNNSTTDTKHKFSVSNALRAQKFFFFFTYFQVKVTAVAFSFTHVSPEFEIIIKIPDLTRFNSVQLRIVIDRLEHCCSNFLSTPSPFPYSLNTSLLSIIVSIYCKFFTFFFSYVPLTQYHNINPQPVSSLSGAYVKVIDLVMSYT
jgi:hypothetical protein